MVGIVLLSRSSGPAAVAGAAEEARDAGKL
jgi:hypothetical protein